MPGKNLKTPLAVNLMAGVRRQSALTSRENAVPGVAEIRTPSGADSVSREVQAFAEAKAAKLVRSLIISAKLPRR